MKDPGQVIVNLLPPESDNDLATDIPNEKTDDPLDKPIIPPVVRLSTPYHSDIGDSGIESGSESDFSQRNIIFSHRNLSKILIIRISNFIRNSWAHSDQVPARSESLWQIVERQKVTIWNIEQK